MNIYIHLYHGRTDPNQDMDEFGEDGPLIGPIEGLHVTYHSHIRPVIDGDACTFMHWHDDMLYFDGKFWGDWSVVTEEEVNDKDYYAKMERIDPRSGEFLLKNIVPCPMPEPWKPEMNTRLTYQYRDGGNYKFPVECVIAGILKPEDVAPYLDDQTDFIPFLVGLPSGQDGAAEYESYPDAQIDHVFNQFYSLTDGSLDPASFEPTTAKPTVAVNAATLKRLFEQHQGWPVDRAMEHYRLS